MNKNENEIEKKFNDHIPAARIPRMRILAHHSLV